MDNTAKLKVSLGAGAAGPVEVRHAGALSFVPRGPSVSGGP
jgi:hypothetical protein